VDPRYLVACDGCRRHYDVTGVAPGARFACECGHSVVARHRAAHTPRALRCSNCGGNLRDQAKKCDYCQAEVTLEERRLTSVCPSCFARMAEDARFCMECGVAVEVHLPDAPAVGSACPRCRAAMHPRTVDGAPLLECTSCGGFWMEPPHFDFVCRRARNEPRIGSGPAPLLIERPPDPLGHAYLPCPECEDFLVRKNFGGTSGVVIDVCRNHGVWLDHGELPRIVRWIREGNDPNGEVVRPGPALPRGGGEGLDLEARTARIRSRRSLRAGGLGGVLGVLGEIFGGDLFDL
jgi:Zn-finger nucleic acid-binding protein